MANLRSFQVKGMALSLSLVFAAACGGSDSGMDLSTVEQSVRPPDEASCTIKVQNLDPVSLEDVYLPTVLACESAASAGPEALRALAVAARSYAYYRILMYGWICDSQGCQVYTCGRYNWNRTGSSVLQTSLGSIIEQGQPGYGQNRGCLSQNGSALLEINGIKDCRYSGGYTCTTLEGNYENILKYYYGMDIGKATLPSTCQACASIGNELDCNSAGCAWYPCAAPHACQNVRRGTSTCVVCPDAKQCLAVSCGDGSCESGESCSSCPGDCGSCPVTCGNPCTDAILAHRQDILTVFRDGGWDTSCGNRDNIINHWCNGGVSPDAMNGCVAEKNEHAICRNYPTQFCGSPCTRAILANRFDILRVFWEGGWNTSCQNHDAIVNHWCNGGVSPEATAGCIAEKKIHPECQ
jgi:hypothetical protein